MRFAKALLASTVLFASTSVFAAETYTYTSCDIGTVATDNGIIDVTLGFQGKYKPTAAFDVSLLSHNEASDVVTIDGLKVRIVKSKSFDTFKNSNCAWAHCYTTTTRVFTVKAELTADESLGFVIMGDVGMPVKKVNNYGTCYEATTVSSTH
jgi:hypothetical protein